MAIKAGTNGIKTNILQALIKMLAWFSTNKEALDDLIEGAPYEPKTTQTKRSAKKAGD